MRNQDTEINTQYLKDGWELSDEESETLHDSRKRAFTFMIDIVRENNLPGDLALNESAVEQFVKCKNNTNVYQQIQFLETEKNTYKSFGSYWLLLAECYYNNGEYRKCLNAFEEYENLNSDIFRKDYYFARTLPLAIAAASEIQTDEKYVETAEKYLDLIVDNIEYDEWSLRYFAAQMYVDLYTRTNNTKYLKTAYTLTLNNVNSLVEKQSKINSKYISEVKEVPIPADALDSEKEKIEDYNEALKEKRETKLPEIYEPLAINCDLLFSLADKIGISESEKAKIEGILSDAFLTEPIDLLFSFTDSSVEIDAEYDEDELTLPVSCVSEGVKIKVTVTNDDKTEICEDWVVDEVERPSDDFSSFKAVFTSDKAGDCTWTENSTVRVEINNGDYSNSSPVILDFKVCNYKTNWIFPDSFDFKQVK